MQIIATRIFICSSIAFGILGVLLVLTLPSNNNTSSVFNMTILRLLMVTIFIILPSFALSIAGKYLKK